MKTKSDKIGEYIGEDQTKTDEEEELRWSLWEDQDEDRQGRGATGNVEVMKSEIVDLIDVEVFSEEECVKSIIENAHGFGVKVIASSHDFNKTPSSDEIIETLRYMQKLNADIMKIAVMPKSKADVLELLNATLVMKEKYSDRPMITISMGAYGLVTRLVGEVFGSDITFGAVGDVSAPGQIDVSELKNVLEILHKNM